MSTITDPALQREFRRAGLSLGALWDERHEGTNGIGTCLAEGGPVTVHREEHFRGYNLSLSCSGAPILDPHGGILAVLDASTANSSDSRLIQRHTMALVNMSAHLISRWNFLNELRQLLDSALSQPTGVRRLAARGAGRNGRWRQDSGAQRKRAGAARLLDAQARWSASRSRNSFNSTSRVLEQRAKFEAERHLAGARSGSWPAFLCDRARAAARFGRARLELAPPSPAGEAADARRADGRSSTSAKTLQMRKNLLCGRQLFAKQVPILLQGATGTGKEAFAKALHRSGLWSRQAVRDRQLRGHSGKPDRERAVRLHARSAFTGAAKEGRVGKILQSNGGTLFLDEIGDMPLMLQTRLLRVIEEREVVPLGSDQALPVSLHVISATHRDIRKMIQDGEFREDLYYRLNGITLHLPLLRDRSDKADLIRTLLQEENSDQESVEIAEDAFRKLLDYSWPGNIRQLRNALRTASALCRDGIIRLSNLPQEILHTDTRAIAPPSVQGSDPASGEPAAASVNLPSAALRDAECAALLRELERMHWNISRTAQALGISRNTLYRKIHKHHILLGH